MNYTLAKKLKDVGFRGKRGNHYLVLEDIPLEELIEACGELELSVGENTSGVRASGHYLEETFYGKTPKIAVAKLYLKLQANK